MDRQAFYVTTPIYYVNDVPHVGHAYTTIAADVLARFYRLWGTKVKFLTGTDEHGQKVEKSALKKGLQPQEFADQVSQHFRDMGETLNLSYDQFIRTTEPKHKQAAQALWQKLAENDQIYKSVYAGWYSVRDETFFNEDELVDGKAPTGSDVEWVEESSYFFRLSHWQQPLLQYYEENPDFIGPKSRRNEVIRFVEGGLHDLSISRSTFKWGVPVPGDDEHVMYVWLDALTNYLTAVGYPDTHDLQYELYWPEALHIVGKDILRHHAVYWPAFLMAAQLPLPKKIFAHGWWTIEGEKMSKSLGNVVDPNALVEKYGVDQLRYFLMREITFGGGGDFSDQALTYRVNSDLANDFGNLVQRVLSFVQKHAGAQVPAKGELQKADQELLDKAKALPDAMLEFAERPAIHKMCEILWAVVGDANRYIDKQEPWALRKSDQARMNTVLYTLAETIRHLAILASPVIPEAADKVLDYLAVDKDQRDMKALKENSLTSGIELPTPQPIFPRIV